MDRIRIRGGRQLKGELHISGSKNAALPLMVAAMLSDKPLTLKNVPRLADINTMIQLLEQHGVEITTAPDLGRSGKALQRGNCNRANPARATWQSRPGPTTRRSWRCGTGISRRQCAWKGCSFTPSRS